MANNQCDKQVGENWGPFPGTSEGSSITTQDFIEILCDLGKADSFQTKRGPEIDPYEITICISPDHNEAQDMYEEGLIYRTDPQVKGDCVWCTRDYKTVFIRITAK